MIDYSFRNYPCRDGTFYNQRWESPPSTLITIKMRADRFVTPRLPHDRIFDCSGRRTDDDDGDTTTKVALIRPQFAASDRSDDPFQSYCPVETWKWGCMQGEGGEEKLIFIFFFKIHPSLLKLSSFWFLEEFGKPYCQNFVWWLVSARSLNHAWTSVLFRIRCRKFWWLV